ncbi:MAG: ATP synthase F1 subunit delta [Bacteroidota bacterium]
MPNIADTYAQTLYQIASQSLHLAQVYEDISNLRLAFKKEKKINAFILNPTINKARKQAFLHGALKAYTHQKTLDFVLFVIAKNRFEHLASIFESFLNLYKKNHHIQPAHVTVAQALNASTRNQFKMLTTKLTGHSQVELVEEVNPSLLGGYILRVADKQIDASLARQLKRLIHLVHYNYA